MESRALQRPATAITSFSGKYVHVNTEREGFLTAERAVNGRQQDGMDVWVYMCGPPAMAKSLAKGFHRLGVPRTRVRWEQFDAR